MDEEGALKDEVYQLKVHPSDIAPPGAVVGLKGKLIDNVFHVSDHTYGGIPSKPAPIKSNLHPKYIAFLSGL